MMPGLPVIARLDGRAFHTFTRGFDRPYDESMMHAMKETTRALVKEFHASVGYTQSDEITLIWKEPSLFDGRYQKMTSVLAGYASSVFGRIALSYSQNASYNWPSIIPCFDCRVFQVPNLSTAIDVLAWREYDATKNSVAMAAQSIFSHKELQNKNRGEQMDMLFSWGINWNDYPVHFKRGIYIRREVIMHELDEHELANIPKEHQPSGPVPRRVVTVVDIPPIRMLEQDEVVELFFK